MIPCKRMDAKRQRISRFNAKHVDSHILNLVKAADLAVVIATPFWVIDWTPFSAEFMETHSIVEKYQSGPVAN
ncbi:hypothetical protein EMIT07CA2_220006 [Brevibacillus sp. IT-7CA2]